MTCPRLLGRTAVLILALAVAPAAAQQVKDHLDLPGPIGFGGTDYALAWSAQPAGNYVKQEYLPAGQSLESWDSMVLVEFVAGDIGPREAAARQAALLDDRKAGDPITNYQVIENAQTGEVILDFVLSARDADGEYIIEWNGYRYAPGTDASGRPGVMLFGISHRAYGNAASRSFLEGLAAFKEARIAELASAPLPLR